jgi:hypothetical protein
VATHRFRCPSCGKTLKVADDLLAEIRRRGRGTHCPRCKTSVPVGVLSELTEPGIPAEPDPAGEPARTRRPNGGRRAPPLAILYGVCGLITCSASGMLLVAGWFTNGPLFLSAAGMALLGLLFGIASRGALRALGVTLGVLLFVAGGGLLGRAMWQRVGGDDADNLNGDLTTLGDVTVRVRRVHLGPVRLEELGQQGDSPTSYLVVAVTVVNDSPTHRVVYAGWGANETDRRVFPLLEDEHGNAYRVVHFSEQTKVLGQATPGTPIEPQNTLDDLLVFEAPIADAHAFRLHLPGLGVGASDTFRFSFPRP